MRTTERYRFSLVPGIPKHSDIDDIVNLAKERVNAGYDYVLCLIDMDVIEGNHDKMEHYRSLKKDNPNYLCTSRPHTCLIGIQNFGTPNPFNLKYCAAGNDAMSAFANKDRYGVLIFIQPA